MNGETAGWSGGREGAQQESFGLVTVMAKRGEEERDYFKSTWDCRG